MLSLAAGELEVRTARTRTIAVEAEGWEDLMVEWLSEILYLFDSGEFIPAAFEFEHVGSRSIEARVQGEPRDPSRHPWQLIVKGVTYHQLQVAQEVTGWRARVILDI